MGPFGNALMQQEEDPRVAQTLERWRQYPGSRPGGTGLTGLHRNDSKGWTQMLNDNFQALQAQSDQPLQVQADYRGTDFAEREQDMTPQMMQRRNLLEALLVNEGKFEDAARVKLMRRPS
jgi:hypothetical protein